MCECASAESVSDGPSTKVGIKLRVRLDGQNKRVDAGELGDSMAGRSEKLIIVMVS